MATGGSTLHGVTDDQKRWLVFGIALNKVLVSQIRSFAEREVQREYDNLQTSHNIHTQSSAGRLKHWPKGTLLRYENINGNSAVPRLPGKRHNYSLFDCQVTSHVDFAKLYLENYMAKFNAFDEHCDASAVVSLLGRVPVFSPAVQSAAGGVRQARNAWAHCVFGDWNPLYYQQRFNEMEQLVKTLGLPPANERSLLEELKEWESKGTILCMNATVDPDLLKLVQQHVNTLKTDVEVLAFEVQEDKEQVSQALKDISTSLEQLEARVVSVEHGQEVMKQEQSSLSKRVDALQSSVDTRVVNVQREQEVMKEEQSSLSDKMKDVQQRVAGVEDKLSSFPLQETRGDTSCYGGSANVVSQQDLGNVSVEIASCEGDIAFFAKRHDLDTRQWFFDDFKEWFHNPGDSRAYVLLGDPGVGKSVLAGVMAQRMRRAGHLAAAYFCRHNDDTRNDPRYLLGTVAHQLCDCITKYKEIIGGESGVKVLLSNSKLGVRELFTKLLQEPLSRCLPCSQRNVVIIDALDETEYKSREAFLDLIMQRFPLLPEWLVFFITSRPEDSVLLALKNYNPCVKICAGNSDQDNIYRQHEQDIQTFLKKRIDFSRLSATVEDISKKCNGLFLYAHYIVEELKLFVDSGKEFNQLSDLVPGDIDSFFRQNFQRVYDQVGQDIFKKLFGCAIVSRAPLPVSMIPYILTREKSTCDEQVIDAISQFVVLRTSDQTLTFLHNLIPAWLTDKNKASRKLFIDKKIAGEYLRTVCVEILPFVVNEPLTGPCIDLDLKDYVLRVGIRFLCEMGDKDSLKVAFDSLTNYHFIERRMKYGRIEIYHLLEDFRILAGHPSLEVKKREILQEILFTIERNVLFLLECPHLLHSCLRNASNSVQETISIPQESAPYLDCTVYLFPDINTANMQCSTTSATKGIVAVANGCSVLFFDAYSVEKVSGPFDLSGAIGNINHLEFTPDGKYLFFGRLDKWFSVERACVEDFAQFSRNSDVYEWGVFTHDGKSIVVKRSLLFRQDKAHSCLSNLLALWALEEIKQSRDGEMTVSFRPYVSCKTPGEQIERLCNHFSVERDLDQSRDGCHFGYDCSCSFCRRVKELSQSNQEPSLETVRQLIIELYPIIFDYQVWDLATGMPVLQEAFLQGIQFNPFIYFCHVSCAFRAPGLKTCCSGTEKATSICNIAAVIAVCVAFDSPFFVGMGWEESLSLKHNCELGKGLSELEMELLISQSLLARTSRNQLFFKQQQVLGGQRDRELKSVVQNLSWVVDGTYLKQKSKWEEEKRKSELEPVPSSSLTTFHNNEFKLCLYTITSMEGFRKFHQSLGTTNLCEEKFIHEKNQEPKIISKFTYCTLTNDGLYFVYSCEGSLHAKSFETGEVFTSVSGLNLYYFANVKRVGYLFRLGGKQKAIFLTNLSSPFMFLVVKSSFVRKSTALMFLSVDSIMSVSSDLSVTVWQTSTAESIPCVSEFSLTAYSPKSLHVKNCVLSSDGSLIAIHQETKVELYSFAKSELKLLHSVLESTYEFVVAYFAFSADSTTLLFYIQDSRNYSHFYSWDIKEEGFSASFKSPGFLAAECCYLSWDKRELVLCGDYEIEIWEYAEHTCRLLTRLAVDKPYHSVGFSQCTVSVDRQFLACCIADVILVYCLNASNINSSKRVLRGHLGRIEFCRFLKINRYLISYGVDGVVFLWDISESKAVGFIRITEGQESIVSMAVSPEEERAVCFLSSGRVHMLKLSRLGPALPAGTSLQLQGRVASGSQIRSSSIEDHMLKPTNSSDSEDVDISDSEEDVDISDYEYLYESD